MGVLATSVRELESQRSHTTDVNSDDDASDVEVLVTSREVLESQHHHTAGADPVGAGDVGVSVTPDKMPEPQHSHTTSTADSSGFAEMGEIVGPGTENISEPDSVPEKNCCHPTGADPGATGGAEVSPSHDCAPESQDSHTTSVSLSDAEGVGVLVTPGSVPESQHPHAASDGTVGAGGVGVSTTTSAELQPRTGSDDVVSDGGVVRCDSGKSSDGDKSSKETPPSHTNSAGETSLGNPRDDVTPTTQQQANNGNASPRTEQNKGKKGQCQSGCSDRAGVVTSKAATRPTTRSHSHSSIPTPPRGQPLISEKLNTRRTPAGTNKK